MINEFSPPPSYYDPPEPKCEPECNCETCHEHHIQNGEVDELSKRPDFQCCKDQMEVWFESGERCENHPSAYCEPGYCEGDPKCEMNKRFRVGPEGEGGAARILGGSK